MGSAADGYKAMLEFQRQEEKNGFLLEREKKSRGMSAFGKPGSLLANEPGWRQKQGLARTDRHTCSRSRDRDPNIKKIPNKMCTGSGRSGSSLGVLHAPMLHLAWRLNLSALDTAFAHRTEFSKTHTRADRHRFSYLLTPRHQVLQRRAVDPVAVCGHELGPVRLHGGHSTRCYRRGGG